MLAALVTGNDRDGDCLRPQGCRVSTPKSLFVCLFICTYLPYSSLMVCSARLNVRPFNRRLSFFSLVGLYLSDASSILLSLAFTLSVSLPDQQPPPYRIRYWHRMNCVDQPGPISFRCFLEMALYLDIVGLFCLDCWSSLVRDKLVAELC